MKGQPQTCCEAYERAKSFRPHWFKTKYRLIGGIPRRWVILYQNTSDKTKAILALGKLDRCACNDAPEPEKFRAWMAACLREDVDPYSDRGEELAADNMEAVS